MSIYPTSCAAGRVVVRAQYAQGWRWPAAPHEGVVARPSHRPLRIRRIWWSPHRRACSCPRSRRVRGGPASPPAVHRRRLAPVRARGAPFGPGCHGLTAWPKCSLGYFVGDILAAIRRNWPKKVWAYADTLEHRVASTRQPQRRSILSDLLPDAHVGYLVRTVGMACCTPGPAQPEPQRRRSRNTGRIPVLPPALHAPRPLDVSPGPIETTTGGRERWQTGVSRL